MAALAALEGLPLHTETLLDGIVDHEARFWLKGLGQARGDDIDDGDFLQRARRFVAALTLRGGTSNPEETQALLQGVDGPRHEDFLPLLRRLYPGTGQKGTHRAYMRGLEPDLLGERLVAKILSDVETPGDVLERVFRGSSEAALQSGFEVLGRIAASRRDEASTGWLAQLLDGDVLGRARPAFQAALTLGESSAFVPLGDLLADRLKKSKATNLAEEFDRQIPEETVSLRLLAVWASKNLLRNLPLEAGDQLNVAERARLTNNLGARLSAVGRREEALKAARESMERYRELAKSRPDSFLPYLAGSLNNLGTTLSDLCAREEALEAARESVELFRELAKSRPDAFLPDLATSLNNLGGMLSAVGRREEALKATRESMERYRDLAKSRPDAFLPDLAASLNNLGNRLSDIGRREEALEAARESVELRRELAKSRPDAFLPDLAASLNNLGNMLNALGRREQALGAARESVERYRELAKSRPAVFLPALLRSLMTLASILEALGRTPEAKDVRREASEIERRLSP